MQKNMSLPGGKSFWRDPDRLIWVLLLLLAAERIYVFFELGAEYRSNADDVAYVTGAICFAKTGTIAYAAPSPSAMIMPGMPVAVGLLSLLFGEGLGLWIATRVVWNLLGLITAYVMYRTGRLLASGWCGLLAAASFGIPNMAWMNNVVHTETPYILFFVLCIYFTFCMERSRDRRFFAGYVLSFMLALMFRANAITMPLFTGAYLLFKRQDKKLLLTRALVTGGVLLLFAVPWSIRNYRQFGAFIPLTYGTGNPLLLGTYEGEGWPQDEELDYDTHVEAVLREKYASYFRETPQPHPEASDSQWAGFIDRYDPEGQVKELRHIEYISLQRDGIKAKYRMEEWFKRDPVSFLKSYLFIKPRWMLNWAWAWEEVLGVSYDMLHRFSQLNLVFCGLTVLLSFWLKKHRAPIAFLGAVYFINVYITATAFVSDRYGAVLMPLRYLIAALGFCLLWEALQKARRKKGRTAPD